jgi:hypothetical protein
LNFIRDKSRILTNSYDKVLVGKKDWTYLWREGGLKDLLILLLDRTDEIGDPDDLAKVEKLINLLNLTISEWDRTKMMGNENSVRVYE